MAAQGCPGLRELFDEAPTPHIAHPPRTHHREYYLATDGSDHGSGGGLGVVVETAGGERVARIARPDSVPDNNVAEYRALHLGLDVLANRTPDGSAVGILLDHDDLASNVNASLIANEGLDEHEDRAALPPRTAHHWRGIQARLAALGEARAATIDGRENPAHPLANAPEAYGHVDANPRCIVPSDPVSPDPAFPPPSRRERPAGD